MTSKHPLIAPLPTGPLDIVGDVHGEFEVLERLLAQLGYDEEGGTANGRTLVFIGDLIDRGPDSPAVVEKVMSLVDAGNAICLLGNHELNALLQRPFAGNGWLVQPNPAEGEGEFNSRPADPNRAQTYLDFFESLPIVLENDELRLVHACWNDAAIDRLRRDSVAGHSVMRLYDGYQSEVQQRLQDQEMLPGLEAEKEQYAVALDNPEWPARILPAHSEAEVFAQMGNPIRVLTTGALQVSDVPFYAMKSWRMADRTKWWDDYDDQIPVVIGHFWRRFDSAVDHVSGVYGKDVFEGIPSHAWMGKHHNVYCVDYSVGQLHLERKRATNGEYHGKLAALRYPEWEVHHDDGTVIKVCR